MTMMSGKWEEEWEGEKKKDQMSRGMVSESESLGVGLLSNRSPLTVRRREPADECPSVTAGTVRVQEI
jgi:hypothetical protein